MRYAVFSDPLYGSELDLEFDPLEVVSVQHRQVSLLMCGKFWVTHVTLKNGAEYDLDGLVGDEIETARRRARAAIAGQ